MHRLALILLVALVSACGGGGDGELSRAEYVERANASCVEAERKLEALGGFANFKELEREMKVGQQALERSAQQLRELTPPAKLRPRHRRLVDLTQQTADLAGIIAIAAGQNDQVEMQKQAERADKLTTSTNEVARQLGLAECVAG